MKRRGLYDRIIALSLHKIAYPRIWLVVIMEEMIRGLHGGSVNVCEDYKEKVKRKGRFDIYCTVAVKEWLWW